MRDLLPKSWEEVSLYTYLEYINIDSSNGYTSSIIDKLCLLTEDDGWEDMEVSYIHQTMRDNKWLNTLPTSSFKETIGIYTMQPLNKMTLAEWIDIEKYIINKEYGCLVAVLYKQTSVDKWNNIEYEPYIYSARSRQEVFLDMPVTDVYGIIDTVINYRSKVLDSYKELFSSIEEDDDNIGATEEEQEYLTPAEIEEIKQNLLKENQLKKLGWQKVLDDISGGNWTYIEGILKLPVLFVFNMMITKKRYEEINPS